MAKRQKPAVGRPPREADTNGIDVNMMDGFVERVEGLHAEGRLMQAEYAKERKSLNQDIHEVYARARDTGIPVQVLRVTIQQRDFDRRRAALPAKLDVDTRYLYDDLQARWDSIHAGRGDPGPGILVKPPREPIGRPQTIEEEIAEAEAQAS